MRLGIRSSLLQKAHQIANDEDATPENEGRLSNGVAGKRSDEGL